LHIPGVESRHDNPSYSVNSNRYEPGLPGQMMQAYDEKKFPITIVHHSHTYDQTLLPIRGGYTMVDRMRKGKKVIIHGDGTSLWVLTHHRDFTKGFVGLLEKAEALGEVFHITSDEVLTWNQIYLEVALAAGAELRNVHVPSELIAAYDPEWGVSLLGDKTHSMIFDNSKIKHIVPEFTATIPFARGAKEILAWYDADPSRQTVDEEFDHRIETIIAAYESAWP
jgi:nucleoside-diphosphate-sugar epimerase